jgi:SAM-dependent methyltransferase
MPFYDHFEAEDITGIGLKWMRGARKYQIDTILQLHPSAERLFEIGPGSGHFAQMWLDRGREYACLEGSSKLAAGLRAKGLTVHEGMAPPIPVSTESVDIAYASHVLEHMHHAGLAIQLAEEMARIVRPGGLVCLVIPDIINLGPLFWDVDYTHNYVTSERRVIQLFVDTGLEVVAHIAMSGPYHGWVAELLCRGALLIPHRLLMAIMPRKWEPERIYRGKMTFLKRVFIVGCKLATRLS